MAGEVNGSSPHPSLTMFSRIENLTINDGKFTQVLGDYHIHAKVSTPTEQDDSSLVNGEKVSVSTTGAVQVGRDYHHHVHHHHPAIVRRRDYFDGSPDVHIQVSTVLPGDPHYHVWRNGEIMFCTMFSPVYQQKKFPVNPSFENMKKYASIILEEIDTGLYYDIGFNRPWGKYFKRYLPPSSYSSSRWIQTRSLYARPEPIVSPKYNLKDYVPPFVFNESNNDKENIYSFPCMQEHAAAAARKSSASATPSPREALFSHLDRSGVK